MLRVIGVNGYCFFQFSYSPAGFELDLNLSLASSGDLPL